MSQALLIVGAGIGGLAAAAAARRAGWDVRVLEQAPVLSEAGAGLQLGPNVTALLREWGVLKRDFLAQCARPSRLLVRDAHDGRELGALRLGDTFESRYGAPYLTSHRADLQQALLAAAQSAGARLHLDTRALSLRQHADGVRALTEAGVEIDADAAVGADGLWSAVRGQVVTSDSAPRPTGHLAYRGLAPQRAVDVTVWLGTGMHIVTYPVRGGDWLNVVCLAEGSVESSGQTSGQTSGQGKGQGGADGGARSWDHPAVAANLQPLLASMCTPLRDVMHAVPQWRLWALHDRQALSGAGGMARGRMALLGDAAHPMLPYLAQGAGMALEDARELQRVLTAVTDRIMDVPTALMRYALNRWQRCARVQRRSQRNGWIFHASGPVRWGRDVSMRLLGERLLDLPWLYEGAR